MLGLALTVLAQEPSLGELARRERDKHKARQAGSTSYDDQDLAVARAARPVGSPTPTPSPASSGKAASSSLEPEYDRLKDKVLEAQWRERFANARTRIAQAEIRAWKTRIETVFVNSIPVQQEIRYIEETEELRQARAAVPVLEEELRRAGLPPGWGR